MFGILFYAPILLCLPVLLVAGVLFCIPGGFIVVLGGLWYALVWLFTGLLGLAVSRRRQAGASRVRPNTSSANASPSGRSSFGSRRAIAARPTAFGLSTDRAVGSAPNLELSRRGSDDIISSLLANEGTSRTGKMARRLPELPAIAEVLPQPPGPTSSSATPNGSLEHPPSLGPESRG